MAQNYQRRYSTVAATKTDTSKDPSQIASNVDHETLRFRLEAPKIEGEKVTIKVRNIKDNTDEEVIAWAYPKDKIADTNATYEKHALIVSFSNAVVSSAIRSHSSVSSSLQLLFSDATLLQRY